MGYEKRYWLDDGASKDGGGEDRSSDRRVSLHQNLRFRDQYATALIIEIGLTGMAFRSPLCPDPSI